MTEPIVRAIDVGYGNTKFVQFHAQGGEIACSLFPSIAPQASSGADLTGGVFQRRNTISRCSAPTPSTTQMWNAPFFVGCLIGSLPIVSSSITRWSIMPDNSDAWHRH